MKPLTVGDFKKFFNSIDDDSMIVLEGDKELYYCEPCISEAFYNEQEDMYWGRDYDKTNNPIKAVIIYR